MPVNQEHPIAPLYGYAFVCDAVEGLMAVDITTLTGQHPDEQPADPQRDIQPDGAATGASAITLAGDFAYLSTDGVSPWWTSPTRCAAALGGDGRAALRGPATSPIQFRYAFVTDAEGSR